MFPEYNKPYCYNNTTYNTRTLLLQCSPAFSAFRTQQTLFVQCFPPFYASRTQQTLCVQCFPPFYAFWQACASPAPLHHRPSLWAWPESIKSKKALNKYSSLCSGSRKGRKTFGQEECAVFWIQKKQENIVIIRLDVIWNDKKQKNNCNRKVCCVLSALREKRHIRTPQIPVTLDTIRV